jgi:hypothetical protein
MKRLMIFAALALLTATAAGCSSTRNMFSGCRLFGNRGAQCDACTVPAAQYCCPQPTCCDPCAGGGYYAGSGYYGGGYSEMAPTLSGAGSCCGGAGGFMPQDGMVYGSGVQVVPGPTTSPMIVPNQVVPGPETSLQP